MICYGYTRPTPPKPRPKLVLRTLDPPAPLPRRLVAGAWGPVPAAIITRGVL